MKIYESVDEMWRDNVISLLEECNPTTSRDGAVIGETIGYKAVLDASAQKTLLTNSVREISVAYAAAEVLWYFGGSGAVAMLEAYAPSYRKFGPIAYGAYGPRLMRTSGSSSDPTDMQRIVMMLDELRDTRQAVLSIWDPKDLVTAHLKLSNDIPCTLTHQYLVRDDKLHMIVNMRSNDAWLGMPYDVFAFTCIQRVIAAELSIGVGLYVHQAGSMHLYERYHDDAFEASSICPITNPHGWGLDSKLDDMETAVICEREFRTNDRPSVGQFNSLGSMACDLVCACAQKTGRDCPLPSSGAMRVILSNRQ